MTTVFGEVLNNATFKATATTGYGTNLVGGNPVPTKKEYEVNCYLLVDSKEIKENPQPNSPPLLWAEGYVNRVVDVASPTTELPAKLPIVIPQGHPITISGVSGRFYFQRTPIPTELLQYTDIDIVGEPIQGWFEAGRL